MKKCDICGKDVEGIYKCGECSNLFCMDCGDPGEDLCEFCTEEDEL